MPCETPRDATRDTRHDTRHTTRHAHILRSALERKRQTDRTEEEELKAMMGRSNGVADDGEMWEEDPLLAGFC